MHPAVPGVSRAATLALLLAAALPGPAPAQAGRQAAAQEEGVAIVVHPDAPIEALSLDQLRRIFMADQQFWPDGSRITLLVRAPAAYERDVVLNLIYRMTEDEFRKYWVGKMFRAEVPAGPKIVYSSEMAVELVTAVPGAIGFVPAGDVIPGAKVIRINGRLPGQPGYPLQ
jgi:ABC-type phosphate transport system substrate-binding protein